MSGHHQLSVPEYKAHPQLLVFTGMKKSAPYTPELMVYRLNRSTVTALSILGRAFPQDCVVSTEGQTGAQSPVDEPQKTDRQFRSISISQ